MNYGSKMGPSRVDLVIHVICCAGIASCPYLSALTVRFRKGMERTLTHTTMHVLYFCEHPPPPPKYFWDPSQEISLGG